MPKRELSRFQSSEGPPPTPREMVLRYSALALSFVLILASLTLRNDPRSSSIDQALHGNFSGFLPFPATSSWVSDVSPKTDESRPPTLMPPALIAPGLLPADAPDDPQPAGAPDPNDSALNVPNIIGRSAHPSSGASQAVRGSQGRLVSFRSQPAVRFDGD